MIASIRAAEQMNVFLNLQWLIGGVRDDEVVGRILFDLRKFSSTD